MTDYSPSCTIYIPVFVGAFPKGSWDKDLALSYSALRGNRIFKRQGLIFGSQDA